MTGLVLSALVAVVVVVVVRAPETADLPTEEPSGASSVPSEGADSRADAAAALLDDLEQALATGTRRDVVALAAPHDEAAVRELATLRSNVRSLRVTDLDLRYVDEDGGRLSPARERALGGRGWVGDVDLSWRLDGFDAGPSHLEITLTFVETKDGAAFVSARDAYGDAAPLWMLGRVVADRSRRALVFSTRDRPRRFVYLARQAVVDVRRVLPSWRGRLVVEVPANQDQLTHVLGAGGGAYGGIAAVTTTVDGSMSPAAPTHVFVNPAVFDPLGPRGSQIVMSHEATHVATRAAVSSMPSWLLEGFADYVALAHVDLPVTVTASQILGDVRKNGPPRHLPGPGDFDPKNKALGATYEAAWLACRLLGEEYGERRLIAFYRASDRSSSTTRPFREVLGTDQRAFTREWRDYLRRLAG